MDEKKLDEAIDRAVRDMTYVAADDDAVARVMARLREADAPAAGGRWMFAPRVAWAGAAALLVIAIVTGYSLRSNRVVEGPRVAVTSPTPSSSQPSQQQEPPQPQPSQPQPPQPLAAREFPTRVAATPSTTQATTGRVARRDDTVRPVLVPLESDIEIASITPAPLGDAPQIEVAPLVTSSLTVDEIPVSPIDMPPVSPEQQK
jgi:hypothetical protein